MDQKLRKYLPPTIIILVAVTIGIFVIPMFDKSNFIDVEATPEKITHENLLFDFVASSETNQIIDLQLKTQPTDLYDGMLNFDSNQTTIMILPVFTANIYNQGQLFFHSGKEIRVNSTNFTEKSSANGFRVLNALGYDWTTDSHINLGTIDLAKYDKLIVLHNKYVTQKEFDIITSHPNVIYLYPGALNSKITMDVNYGWIKYDSEFNWKNDNTRFKTDINCKEPQFYKVDNGYMLNCYPEFAVLNNPDLLRKIKEL